MRRRNFFSLILWTASISFGFGCRTKPLYGEIEKSIAERLKSELPFIDHNQRDLFQFAAEALQSRKIGASLKNHFSGITPKPPDWLVYELTRIYLLSTDYFTGGEKQPTKVRYLGFYDPYKRPCAHPFLEGTKLR